MANFKPRLTAPSTADKNFIKSGKGGNNPCIEISNGSVLPNCVGYSWGRWRELLGKDHKLSRNNAEVWWGNTSDGYQRSQTPKLGSVICWRQGSLNTGNDGAGHVAIVEDIKSDGTIITSNSAYGGSRFYLRTLKPPYNMGGTYKFQGFIHPPVDFKVEKPKPTPELTVKVGDNVTFSGRVHKGSNGDGPGLTFKDKKGRVNYTNPGALFPVHIESLGWIKMEEVHKPPVNTKNKYGQNVQVGSKITFSYIRKNKNTNVVIRPYFRNKQDRGYGVVKKIHTDVTKHQGAYEVYLDEKNKETIGFVAPINTY